MKPISITGLPMRLSLEIDDLDAATGIAGRERRTVGAAVSDLARRALNRSKTSVPLLETKPNPAPSTREIVNGLRDGVA